MNRYFKIGFLKTAGPELTSDSDQGGHWDTKEEYRYKRQKLLESYSTEKDTKNSIKKKERNEILFPETEAIV